VGHAIHSITVQDIQQFEPAFTRNNSIPTINRDLKSDVPILLYAPEASASPYENHGMRVLDAVLSHVTDHNYEFKRFTPLERVVHAFHMQELWSRAGRVYKTLNNQPPTPETCRCAIDIDNNGIMKTLRYLALQIREPTLIYGNDPNYSGYKWFWSELEAAELLPGGGKVLSADGILRNQEESMPHLTEATMAEWTVWSKALKNIPEEMGQDLAVFLYCSINRK